MSRRRAAAPLALLVLTLIVLRLTGILHVPTKYLALAAAVDVVLAVAELALLVAAARAFLDGRRRGGLLVGYEAAIERERELGVPAPVVKLMEAEARLLRALERRLRSS